MKNVVYRRTLVCDDPLKPGGWKFHFSVSWRPSDYVWVTDARFEEGAPWPMMEEIWDKQALVGAREWEAEDDVQAEAIAWSNALTSYGFSLPEKKRLISVFSSSYLCSLRYGLIRANEGLPLGFVCLYDKNDMYSVGIAHNPASDDPLIVLVHQAQDYAGEWEELWRYATAGRNTALELVSERVKEIGQRKGMAMSPAWSIRHRLWCMMGHIYFESDQPQPDAGVEIVRALPEDLMKISRRLRL